MADVVFGVCEEGVPGEEAGSDASEEAAGVLMGALDGDGVPEAKL
ncbi:MAG TPA: hypothetical protein VF070_06540 [Streptosporangiaceae bacterium]